jgi:hypothetical protein
MREKKNFPRASFPSITTFSLEFKVGVSIQLLIVAFYIITMITILWMYYHHANEMKLYVSKSFQLHHLLSLTFHINDTQIIHTMQP